MSRPQKPSHVYGGLVVNDVINISCPLSICTLQPERCFLLIDAVVLKYKRLSLSAEVNPSPQPPPFSLSVLNNYDIITASSATATLPRVAKNKVGQTKKGDLNYKPTRDIPATFVASQTVINHAWCLRMLPVGLLFGE